MSYDTWKARAPEDGQEPPTPCPVCTGDESADPCSEDCAGLIDVCRRERLLEGLNFARRQVVRMALRYRTEAPAPDPRVAACLRQARVYRTKIRMIKGAA